MAIKDSSDATIRILVDNQALSAGTYTVNWDGTNTQGLPVHLADDYKIYYLFSQGGVNKVRNGNISIDIFERGEVNPAHP